LTAGSSAQWRQPVHDELGERLGGWLQVAAGVHRRDNLAECPLCIPLGPEATVPTSAGVARNAISPFFDPTLDQRVLEAETDWLGNYN
jgi:hypothetical protein